MVNEKYLLRAKNLAERNKNLLDANRSPKEKEIDRLFYWIMNRLECSVQGYGPVQTSHSVKIKTHYWYDDGSVLLKNGRIENYLSKYVKGEEFYDIMTEVADIFNEIGKSDENGYYFYAICCIPENKTKTAELSVQMIINQ